MKGRRGFLPLFSYTRMLLVQGGMRVTNRSRSFFLGRNCRGARTGAVFHFTKWYGAYPIMRTLFSSVLIFLLLGASLSPAEEPSLSSLPFVRIEPNNISSPAYPIAAPLAGGAIRILFFGQREMVGLSAREIASRLECEYESVLTESRDNLSPPVIPSLPDSTLFLFPSITKRVSELLGRPWDVIWLDFEIGALPEQIRIRMLEKVSGGTGLVYIGNGNDLKRFSKKGSLKRDWFGGMSCPAGRIGLIAARGRGNVLSLPEFDRRSDVRTEGDYFAQAVNALMIIGNRGERFVMTGVRHPGKSVEYESMSLMSYRVDFLNERGDASRKVHVRYRGEKGNVVSESEESFFMRRGNGFFRITYPVLPLGTYSADISVLEDGKVIALAGKPFMVKSDDCLVKIEMRNRSARPGEFLSGRVKMYQEVREGMTLVLDMINSEGRKMSSTGLVPEPRRRWIDFVFRTTGIMSGMMTLRATLYKNNQLIHVLEEPVFVKSDFPAGRFSLVVTGRSADEPWLVPGYTLLSGSGVTAFALDETGGTPAEAYRAAVCASKSGASPVPVFSLEGEVPERRRLAYVLSVVDTLRQMRIPACWMKRPLGKAGRAGSEATREETASFRTFLERKYVTIARLNREWGADYTDFGQAARHRDGTGSNPVRRDCVLYALGSFSGKSDPMRRAIARRDTLAHITVNGYFANHEDGYIPLALREISRVAERAAFPDEGEDFSGIIRGNIFGPTVGSAWQSDSHELGITPWRSLFQGLNAVCWPGVSGNAGGALKPGGGLNPSFSLLAEESRRIMDGPDLLLSGAERLEDGVAILFSPESIAICRDDTPALRGIAGAETEPERTDAGFDPANPAFRSVLFLYTACADAGYLPRFITEEMVEKGCLAHGKYRVLFLPRVRALGDSAAAAVKRFVRNGGTVVADVRPGLADDRFVTRKSGALDSIFGIAAASPVPERELRGSAVYNGGWDGFSKGFSIGGCSGDPAIAALKGTGVYGAIAGAPAFLLSRVSGGKGILLNFGMEVYSTSAMKYSLRRFLFRCIETSMGSAVVVDREGNPSHLAKGTIFKDGDALYIGVLPFRNADSEANDGVVTIRVEDRYRLFYLYDLRDALYRGLAADITVDVKRGGAGLLALLPYKVKNLDIRLSDAVFHMGSSVEYDVSVIAMSAEAEIGRHVLIIQVIGPDGEERAYLHDMRETSDGKLKGSFHLPSVELQGKWVLRIRDVVSGKSVERPFLLMP